MSSSSLSDSQETKRGVKRKRNDVVVETKAKANNKASADSSSDSEDSGATSGSDSDSESSPDEDGKSADEDIQVLSRAAQRKLKKKEQKEAKNPTSTIATAPEPETEPTKRLHSIWVGNLAFKTTEQSLRAFFERGVSGCTITRVNLPTKSGRDVGGGKDGVERKGMRGENKGFAYLDFSTKEFKEQAIALSEQNLDGRKLLIKDGNDYAGRPTTTSAEAGAGPALAVGKSKTAQKILASQKQPPAQTLFLGNLGFQATEESIKTMLEAHMKSSASKSSKKDDSDGQAEVPVDNGKKGIRKVRLGTFEDSGLCKGWAFVDFHNIEDATAVLIDPRNHHLDGRKLKVEYASAEAVRRGGGAGAKAHRDNKETMKRKSNGRRLDHQEAVATVQPTENPEKEDEPIQKKPRVDKKEHEARVGKGKRTRPGAALAMAKRENVAIVPSSGKRTVF